MRNVPLRITAKFLLKMGKPRPLLSLFKQTKQFLQQINVKNVHPVTGAGIRTHNLLNMSRIPQPLDQGSRPTRPPMAKLPKGGGLVIGMRAVLPLQQFEFESP